MGDSKNLDQHYGSGSMLFKKFSQMYSIKRPSVISGIAHYWFKTKLNGWSYGSYPGGAWHDDLFVFQPSGTKQGIVHQQICRRAGVARYGIRSPQPIGPLFFVLLYQRSYCESRRRVAFEPISQSMEVFFSYCVCNKGVFIAVQGFLLFLKNSLNYDNLKLNLINIDKTIKNRLY